MKRTLLAGSVVGLAGLTIAPIAHAAWWNSDWSVKKQITFDTTGKGVPISQPIDSMAFLIRLHDGDFQFLSAKEDGTDIRFIAADGKTILPYHIERFDSLLGEAFIWVKVPGLKPDAPATISLYYGNTGATAVKAQSSKGIFDSNTVLVYHFAEKGAPPVDSSGNGNVGQGMATPSDGSMIGTGIRLTGRPSITIPASPSLTWSQGGAMTWSAWVKPASLAPNAVIYSRSEGANTFRVGMDNGVPYLEINGQRSGTGPPVAVNTWHQLAVTAAGNQAAIYLDGQTYSNLSAALPAMNSPASIGGDATEQSAGKPADGFNGEMDELELSSVARTPDYLKLRFADQSGDKDNKLVSYGPDEQHKSWFSGGGTLSILVSSLTLDGWIVIIVLAFMSCISWWIMVSKVRYLNAITKGNAIFMKQWRKLSEDVTLLDEAEGERFRSAVGIKLDRPSERAMRQGSLYHIYHLGVEEVRQRIAADNAAEGTRRGLAGRSIQAIRAVLDGGQVRETQKINRLIVLLTICISGGPFLGLLGTVIGVMITFAAIAAAGDVNVNAIAPGIAAALLATVAGLSVAIPALFGYNYIISRVKDCKDDMAIFIDEFVTKMAEFYRETPEPFVQRPEFFQRVP